jgi:predicted DNA-binding protein
MTKPTAQKPKAILIQLDDNLYSELKTYSEKTLVPMAALVRKLITEHLANAN